MGQDLDQKLMNRRGPGGTVVSARRCRFEARPALEPLMAQLVEAATTQEQAFHGRLGVEVPIIERGQDLLDVKRTGAVGELAFFMGRFYPQLGALPPSPRSFSLTRELNEFRRLTNQRPGTLASPGLSRNSIPGPELLRLRFRRAVPFSEQIHCQQIPGLLATAISGLW